MHYWSKSSDALIRVRWRNLGETYLENGRFKAIYSCLVFCFVIRINSARVVATNFPKNRTYRFRNAIYPYDILKESSKRQGVIYVIIFRGLHKSDTILKIFLKCMPRLLLPKILTILCDFKLAYLFVICGVHRNCFLIIFFLVSIETLLQISVIFSFEVSNVVSYFS